MGNFASGGLIGGWSFDQPTGLEMGLNGLVYLSGRASAPANIDPGPLSYVVQQGAFIVGINSAGSLVRPIHFESLSSPSARALLYDMRFNSRGELLVSGAAEGTVDLDPGPSVRPYSGNTLSGGFPQSGFLLQIDTSDSLSWVSEGLRIRNFSIGQQDQLYASDAFTEISDLAPSLGALNLSSAGAFQLGPPVAPNWVSSRPLPSSSQTQAKRLPS